MPKRNKSVVAVQVFGLVIGFALVRFFEQALFYDPFLLYFKGEFQQRPLPDYEPLRLLAGYLFRYSLNAALSLLLLWVLFRSRSKLVFAGALYGLFFVLLMAALFITTGYFEEGKLAVFYIRRFLIQPLWVVLFIPAFYYQDRQTSPSRQ